MDRPPSSRRYLTAQLIVEEGQPYHAPAVVSGYAVPFPKGALAQPVRVITPVYRIRRFVERDKGLPFRDGRRRRGCRGRHWCWRAERGGRRWHGCWRWSRRRHGGWRWCGRWRGGWRWSRRWSRRWRWVIGAGGRQQYCHGSQCCQSGETRYPGDDLFHLAPLSRPLSLPTASWFTRLTVASIPSCKSVAA